MSKITTFGWRDILKPNKSVLEDFWIPTECRKGGYQETRPTKQSDHFKCPNCGKTHHTASFVKCEYCGFGRQKAKPIMNTACSAAIDVFGYKPLKPNSYDERWYKTMTGNGGPG